MINKKSLCHSLKFTFKRIPPIPWKVAIWLEERKRNWLITEDELCCNFTKKTLSEIEKQKGQLSKKIHSAFWRRIPIISEPKNVNMKQRLLCKCCKSNVKHEAWKFPAVTLLPKPVLHRSNNARIKSSRVLKA